MPGRKNIKKKLAAAHNKQLKLITSRLIEISLKVDDYIYKQKPITVANARMYKEEVCSYRIHCKQDARSLQVIEKLIYQMKSIIEEQEETKQFDNIYELIQNSCLRECEGSPVYSLADSNLTDEVVEISDSDTRVLKKTSRDLESIDLCDNDDKNTVTVMNKNEREHPNVSDVNEMQKCLSTLSLKEAEDSIHMNSDDEMGNYSQSVLDVSLSLSEMTKNNLTKNTNNNRTTDIDTTLFNHNDKTDSAPLFTYNNNAIETLNLNASITFVNNVTGNDIPMSSGSKFFNMPNEKVDLIKSKLVNNKPVRKRKPKVTHKKIINNKCNDNKKKRKPKKPVNAEIVNVTLGNENNKPICSLSEQIHKQSPNTSKPSAAVNIPKPKTSNSICNIYNNEIVDDLSWIENIRYVREVTLDEFDPKLTYLDESFWDNYALPNNWNDRDFMY